MASQDSKKFLKTYTKNNFVTKAQLTEDQHLVLDNIWNIPTAPQDNKQKMSIIYTLVDLFTCPIENKKFSMYCLFNGPEAGIYSSWEELIPKIKYIDQNPKYGRPTYKGYYDLETAKKAIEKIMGTDYILSETIEQISTIASGKLIKNETPQQPINLRPNSSYAAVTAKEKGKMVSLGTPSHITPPKNTQLTEDPQSTFPDQLNRELYFLHHPIDLNVTIYKKAYTFFAAISEKPFEGLQINWEVVRNRNISCTKAYKDCDNFMTDCRCTIVAAYPQLSIKLSQYKFLTHEGLTFDPQFLLNYGFINKLYLDSWTQAELPEPLGNISDYFSEVLDTEVCLEITSIPPHFGKINFDPARHLVKLKAYKFDLDYPIWDNQFISYNFSTIKMQEQSAYERYRAYILGINQGWIDKDDEDYILISETPVIKTYIGKSIQSYIPKFRVFDVYHPKPSIITTYKKLNKSRDNDNMSQHTSEDMEN